MFVKRKCRFLFLPRKREGEGRRVEKRERREVEVEEVVSFFFDVFFLHFFVVSFFRFQLLHGVCALQALFLFSLCALCVPGKVLCRYLARENSFTCFQRDRHGVRRDGSSKGKTRRSTACQHFSVPPAASRPFLFSLFARSSRTCPFHHACGEIGTRQSRFRGRKRQWTPGVSLFTFSPTSTGNSAV